MSSTIAAPVNWVEAVGKLHFPSKADRRLQELMDRHEMEGRTAVGHATVVVLDLNDFRRQRIRQVEEVFGLYTPTP